MTTLPPVPSPPSPPPPPPLHAPPPAASSAKAGWALGLAILGCAFVGNVVSFFLALSSLRQSRRTGVDHGNGLAVAALSVNALVVGSFVALLYVVYGLGVGWEQEEVAAYDADRTVNANPNTVYNYDALFNGDCLVVPSWHGDEESWERTVDCSEPHDVEVTDSISFESGPYPGDAAVRRGAARCDRASFTDYVGRPLHRSVLDSAAIPFDRESWEDGRRQVVCLVFDPSGPLTSTVYGADR